MTADIDVAVLEDSEVEGSEEVSVTLDAITSGDSNIVLGTTNTATVNIDDDDGSALTGAAVLTITANKSNVQISNFGNNSFKITNEGDKKIASVNIDVTNALYSDSVFDPFGLAGDTTSKALTINTNGGTGVLSPNTYNPYVGTGGASGYKGLNLIFDEAVNGGFESGETIGFAIDMDPNSVAGTNKGDLDGGSSPSWDVGGVSGAELIGSTFTVTFTDGSTATGQLQGDGSQGGSQALAAQSLTNQSIVLTVNGLSEGSIGTYDASGPSVIVNGPAGQIARVVLTKGFIQPVTPYASFLEDQLNILAASDFPANNAVEFQTVDVVLTGADQDISGLFNFSGVPIYNFAGEDQLPLGFVASIIDSDQADLPVGIEPNQNDLPIGAVTQPIYLQFDDGSANAAAASASPANSSGDEAEDGINVTNYQTEAIGAASNGEVPSLVDGDTDEMGPVSVVSDQTPGSHDILTGAFDENDGEEQLPLGFVDGITDSDQADLPIGDVMGLPIGDVIGEPIILNQDLGSGSPTSLTAVEMLGMSSLQLNSGDILTVTGGENAVGKMLANLLA